MLKNQIPGVNKMQSDILNNELNLIKDEVIRNWTKVTLELVPEYFWVAQASSSGKWHPECTNKKGGLITHVKRVVYLANRLCEGWGIFDYERDIVISACILHDIAKVPGTKVMHLYGMNVTSEDFYNHPLNATNYFAKNCELNAEPNETTINIIQKCVAYHMGRWTPESIKKPIVNYSLMELVVYTCDYMATTKELITPVDKE